MSRLLPSEVARLVLGYLKERGCHKSHDEFLKESPDLGEFRSCLSGPNTYDYPTSVNGKSLIQFLNNNSQPPAPHPLMAQAVPVLTTTLPIITTPVPSPAVTAVSQREIDLLRKLQANQATIANLNSKMNQMAGKSRSSNDKRSAKQSNHATVQSHEKQQAVTCISRPQISQTATQPQPAPSRADPFKTPIKQIVRRSHQGHTTPSHDKGKAGQVPSPKKSTPRKSLTPRKLSMVSDATSSAQSSGQSSDKDSTLTPSKINMNNIHIEAEKVVEKFISDPSMPELLAEEINKIWNSCNGSGVVNLVNGDISVLASGAHTPVKSAAASDAPDDSAAAPFDKVVNTVVKELEQHSTINQFISDFTANECLMDTAFSDLDCLFGSESSPFSSYDSTPVHSVGDDQEPGSLTTPKSAYREQPIASSSPSTASAVKNLMQDLKTPEKKVPSPSPFNSSPFLPADKTTSTPVCIVIPDDGSSSHLFAPVLQLVHEEGGSGTHHSPAKKFRRIAPDLRKLVPAPAAAPKHIPVQAMATTRVAGGRKSVSSALVEQAQRSLLSVPGKRVKQAAASNKQTAVRASAEGDAHIRFEGKDRQSRSPFSQ